MRRLAVNVDIDGLRLYRAIHGLAAQPGDAADLAWTVGVPRFADLFESFGVRGTFFVVAEDLEVPAHQAIARRLVAAGHELASHSDTHPYDLTRKSDLEIEGELRRADAAISALRGSPVAGFRGPGYNTNDVIGRALKALGYAYESSRFPCPPYYAARACAIAAMRLVGRRSHSIVGNPAHAFGDLAPSRNAHGLVDFPMSVLPGIRFPLIGTSLTLLGATALTALAPVLRSQSFLNLEFHALDLLDRQDLGGRDEALATAQLDLRRPVKTKLAAFAAALRGVVPGAEARTLEEHAAAWP
ncbi:MAG: polysaccharide deacetylase family protein [Myxococcales bacterium]|nr:polysaccharide deacetylase family protein [Myxococcales bacterium]